VSTAIVEIVYDGDALATGSMDVQDLAPALLALGDLCREANRVLNGDRARVEVRVRSDFKTGSFVVGLEVVQSLLEQARSLLLDDNVAAALQLAGLLGLLKGGKAGLIRFLKWLEGKAPDKVERQPNGDVIVYKIDQSTRIEQTIIISAPVVLLAEDVAVRDALRRILRPLEMPGIDHFETREGGQTVEVVEEPQVPFFDPPKAQSATEKPLAEDVRIAAFEVARSAFEDRLKWSLSDGKTTINAEILDEEFLARVDRGLRFGKHDVLKVQLQTQSHRTATGRLVTEYKVLKVLEVVSAPSQYTLFPTGEG
jgi:hypothetical protein